MSNGDKTVKIIVGPTASGKSALSLRIAQECKSTIINADSMQVYKEIPILSAAPTTQETKNTSHKLYGIISIKENCSVALWRNLAIKEIHQCFDNDTTPILVGGTGLYIKALIEGLSPVPQIPQSVREKTVVDYVEMGGKAFKERLASVDKILGEQLNENDSQRLIRAWEVFEHTGKTLSHFQSIDREKPPADWSFNIHVLLPPRDILYERINSRFDLMLDNGMMDEVRAVNEITDLNPLLSSLKALGLPHLRAFLDDNMTLDEAVEKAKTASRQYAKRQYTWFRNQLPEQHSNHLTVKHHNLFGKDISF